MASAAGTTRFSVLVIQKSSAWLTVLIGVILLSCAHAAPPLTRSDNANSQCDDLITPSMGQHFLCYGPIKTVQLKADLKSSSILAIRNPASNSRAEPWQGGTNRLTPGLLGLVFQVSLASKLRCGARQKECSTMPL